MNGRDEEVASGADTPDGVTDHEAEIRRLAEEWGWPVSEAAAAYWALMDAGVAPGDVPVFELPRHL